MKKKGAPKLPRLNIPQDDGDYTCHRMPPPPWDSASVVTMLHHMAILRVDPDRTNYTAQESSIAISVAFPVMPEIFDHINFELNSDWLGERMFELLANEKSETIEQVFSDIVRMKKQAENPPSRAYWAFLGYIALFTKKGTEPSKSDLRKYMVTNQSTYKNLPSEGDGKGWTRLWESAGLTLLRQR
jgi:hypothetical protein